jgi:hypothetical protein
VADFITCVTEAVKAGALTKANGDRIIKAADPEKELDNIALEMNRTKRETMQQAIVLQKAYEDMSGVEDKGEGLIGLLTKSEKANYSNVEYRARVIAAKFHARNADMLSRFRTRKLGLSQDADGLRKLVRALYGEAIDDSDISAYAKSLSETYEELRQTFNKVGGSISKNENWTAPQTHNARAIKNIGLGTWKAEVLPMLDRTKMLDDVGNMLTDKQLDDALNYTFETITTGGLNKIKDLTVPMMGKKLARRHSERRFLYFKDADSWLAYNEKYGKSDVLTTLTDHIETLSHDVAMMERLGPNPSRAFEALRMQAKKEGAKALKLRHADAIYNVASGKIGGGELMGLADASASVSNVLTASTLGSAFLSALSDVAFNSITSSYRGMNFIRPIMRQLSGMNPANESDRIFAAKLGLIAESWNSRATAANRWADVYGVGPSAKTAEVVMRASLLSPWTEAGRHGFGLEFSSMLADNFGKSFDDLSAPIKRSFADYGITADDWDIFRSSNPMINRGAPFADFTQDGGAKFHEMVLSETEFAVPSPDYRVRAITTGGLERGSIKGQVWRAPMMLKSFPLTLITTHLARLANQATLGDKLGYGAALFASTTILGGVALQAKDIAAGREPRNMDGNGNLLIDKEFLVAAAQQGGGLGIYGDFIFSDQNRFGSSVWETIGGPKIDVMEKAVDITLGNIQQLARGEETDIMGEAVALAGRYQPKIWQTRLFQDAYIDALEKLADDDAEAGFRREIRKRQTDFNQGYWWKPGEPLPEALSK